MVRLNQVLLAISVVIIGVALATGCLGCGPGSTEYIGTEANVASNPDQVVDGNSVINPNVTPTPVDNIDPEPFTGTVVDGKPCDDNEHEVLYDASGNPAVCADATTVCEGKALYKNANAGHDGYMKRGQQVCEYEPPIVIDDHPTQCNALTPGDGQWFEEDSDEPMVVGCNPTPDGCAVTPSGEGSLFSVTFVGSEFPLVQEDGIYTRVMDITEDGRLVQRRYTNLNDGVDHITEAFFRR